MPQNEEKALRMLGFAARARRVTAGASLICAALQKGGAQRPLLVLLAADASENTKKRMTDRTAYYHVPLYTVSADCERLALAVGKRDGAVAAVGISEPGIAEEITRILKSEA